MAFGSRIQRYIFRECLLGLALTFGIILSAIVLVDVVEQLRTVGEAANISVLVALRLTLLKVPMLLEQTMPFLILVSSILVYSRLSRQSELPAMRAAGISAWRFLAPVALMAFLLGIFAITVLNPIGARLTASFEQARSAIVGQSMGEALPKNGIWLRQGSDTDQFVIRAQSTEQSGVVLKGVKIFEYERIFGNGRENFAFKRRLEADTATLKDGFWELSNVVENTPGLDPIQRRVLSIPTDLNPAKLLDRFASTSTIGFWDLPQFIADTRRAGLDASRYQMHYHSLLAAPILFVAMALIGALVCLRLARLGGTAQLIAWGAFAAIMLYFITELAQSLGAAGAAPTLVAAMAPPLFALFGALTAIAFLEDG